MASDVTAVRRLPVFILSVSIALAAGCSTGPTRESLGPIPNNWKSKVHDHVKQNFLDPYSLRDVSVADPMPGIFLFQEGWLVCMKANGKNSFGGYVGITATGFLFKDQEIRFSDQMPQQCGRADLVYSPWPEMEMMGDRK